MKKWFILLIFPLLVGCQPKVVLEPLHREHYFENYGVVHDETMDYLYRLVSLILEDGKIDVVASSLKNDYPDQDFKPFIEVSILSTTIDLEDYLNQLYEEIGMTYPVIFKITTLEKNRTYTGYIDRVLEDRIWVKSHYETKYNSEWIIRALDVHDFDLTFEKDMVIEYVLSDEQELLISDIEILGTLDDVQLKVLESLNKPMDQLTPQEIVILNELMLHQFTIFELPYDELRVFHDEFLLYGDQLNDRPMPIGYIYSSRQPVSGSHLVGLNIDEMKAYLIDNHFITDGYFDLIDQIKEQKITLSVSDVIPGFSDDEYIVFAIKKSIVPQVDTTLETYQLLRYTFKEVGGMTKIYVRKESYTYSTFNAMLDQIERERFESMYNYFEPDFNMEIHLNDPLYYHK